MLVSFEFQLSNLPSHPSSEISAMSMLLFSATIQGSSIRDRSSLLSFINFRIFLSLERFSRSSRESLVINNDFKIVADQCLGANFLRSGDRCGLDLNAEFPASFAPPVRKRMPKRVSPRMPL